MLIEQLHLELLKYRKETQKVNKTVYVVDIKRTAVGKASRGTLRSTRPDDMCAAVIKDLLRRNPKLDPQKIDDVIVGCAMPEAQQGMNIGRFVSLLAGLPESVPGVTVNRFCSSGLQTMAMAAHQIAAGGAECILAGGTESMSMVPMMGHVVVAGESAMAQDPNYYLGMGLTAENVAKEYKVSREEQDAFATESHKRAVKAIGSGLFKDEITALNVTSKRMAPDGSTSEKTMTFDTDEGPRGDTSVAALSKLRAVFKAGGSVTAGNSSQMSDGAAMSILASEEFVKEHGLVPRARFCGFAVAGVPPKIMGIGPVAAIPKALKQAGINQKEIERMELNEAFASQALAVIRKLGLDPAITNPTGGAIALGHPLGTTGCKLAATLLYGMQRDKQKYGMVSMCIGTGMGAAGVFENLL